MYDVAIIGCGVIGAAAAYALSRYDNKVVILEAENDVADCTTKANSAILHAGSCPFRSYLLKQTALVYSYDTLSLHKKQGVLHFL